MLAHPKHHDQYDSNPEGKRGWRITHISIQTRNYSNGKENSTILPHAAGPRFEDTYMGQCVCTAEQKIAKCEIPPKKQETFKESLHCHGGLNKQEAKIIYGHNSTKENSTKKRHVEQPSDIDEIDSSTLPLTQRTVIDPSTPPPHDPKRIKWKKMEVWMDGWIQQSFCICPQEGTAAQTQAVKKKLITSSLVLLLVFQLASFSTLILQTARFAPD
ncbi:uncharacterized protein KZ484_023106 [Pholidichthys leucotaenia]